MAKDTNEIIRMLFLRRIIGQNIKKLRKKHNLTQKKLASLAGITQAAIAEYETFKWGPSLETLLLIADALGESPNTLLEGWETLFKSTRKM